MLGDCARQRLLCHVKCVDAFRHLCLRALKRQVDAVATSMELRFYAEQDGTIRTASYDITIRSCSMKSRKLSNGSAKVWKVVREALTRPTFTSTSKVWPMGRSVLSPTQRHRCVRDPGTANHSGNSNRPASLFAIPGLMHPCGHDFVHRPLWHRTRITSLRRYGARARSDQVGKPIRAPLIGTMAHGAPGRCRGERNRDGSVYPRRQKGRVARNAVRRWRDRHVAGGEATNNNCPSVTMTGTIRTSSAEPRTVWLTASENR